MKEGTREWDEHKLRSCLYAHDVEEVLRIRPSWYGNEDTITWFYEKSVIFTVKSAYRLVISEDRENKAGSSALGNLDRSLFKELWNAEVPPKVPIFAWKLAADGLAKQDKRSRRGLVPNNQAG
jgi:hypothetical protein